MAKGNKNTKLKYLNNFRNWKVEMIFSILNRCTRNHRQIWRHPHPYNLMTQLKQNRLPLYFIHEWYQDSLSTYLWYKEHKSTSLTISTPTYNSSWVPNICDEQTVTNENCSGSSWSSISVLIMFRFQKFRVGMRIRISCRKRKKQFSRSIVILHI